MNGLDGLYGMGCLDLGEVGTVEIKEHLLGGVNVLVESVEM